MPFTRISVAQAKELIAEKDPQIVDVRDQPSYQNGHMDNAVLVSDANVQEFIQQADWDRPLIVCCYHGNMSQSAADFFSNNGFEEVYSLDGGYAAWSAAQ